MFICIRMSANDDNMKESVSTVSSLSSLSSSSSSSNVKQNPWTTLLVRKYRPSAIDELTLHPEVTIRLKKVVNAADFPHLLLHGPPGAGKKTRAHAIIARLYGRDQQKTRMCHEKMKAKVETSLLRGSHHVEINPSFSGSFKKTKNKKRAQTQSINDVNKQKCMM